MPLGGTLISQVVGIPMVAHQWFAITLEVQNLDVVRYPKQVPGAIRCIVKLVNRQQAYINTLGFDRRRRRCPTALIADQKCQSALIRPPEIALEMLLIDTEKSIKEG